MRYYTHLIFGSLIALLSLFFLNMDNKILFIFFVLVGSLLPDLDKRKSFIGRRFKLSYVMEKILGHRGIFHSIFPIIIIYLFFIYYLQLNLIGYGLILGYFGHLLIDSLNSLGVGYFYPILDKKIHWRAKIGGLFEHILFIISLILIIFIVNKLFF